MSTAAAGLADFGTRSLLTHAMMAVTLLSGFAIGLTIESQLGLVSFVALLNFTAGVWVCQSIHSLGNTAREDEYDGVLAELKRYVE